MTFCGLRSPEGNWIRWTWIRSRLILYVLGIVGWSLMRPTLLRLGIRLAYLFMRLISLLSIPRSYLQDVQYQCSRSTLHTTWTLRVALNLKPVTTRGKHRSRRHYGTYQRLHPGVAFQRNPTPKPSKHSWNWKDCDEDDLSSTMDRIRRESCTSSAVDRTLKAYPPLDLFKSEMELRAGFMSSKSQSYSIQSAFNATADLLGDPYTSPSSTQSTQYRLSGTT